MKDKENEIYDIFKRLISDYKAEIEPNMWQNIEKRLPKKQFSWLKFMTIICALIIAAAVATIVLTPAKKTKTFVSNVEKKTVAYKNNQPDYHNNQLEYSVNQPDCVNRRIEKNNEPTIEYFQVYDIGQIINDYSFKNLDKKDLTPPNQTPIPHSKDLIKSSIIKDTVNHINSVTQLKQDLPKIKIDSVLIREKLLFPSAFEPNSNDERINTFKPVYKDVKSFTMRIFARSGTLLYQTNDIHLGWDGMYKGSLMDKGVYVYIVEYVDLQGQKHTEKNPFYLSR